MLAVICPAFYMYLYIPMKNQKELDTIKKNEQDKLNFTTAKIQYNDVVNLGVYQSFQDAVINSDEFVNYCLKDKIKLKTIPLEGESLFDTLDNDSLQMAILPIDKYVSKFSKINNPKFTIVGVLSDNSGLYKLVHLNPDIKSFHDEFTIVLDKNSQFFSSCINFYFGVDKTIRIVNSHKEVYDLFLKSNPTDKLVFLLHEPYVSLVNKREDVKSLIDFNSIKNIFLDVFIVSRDFLYQKPEMVSGVLTSYFKTNRDYFVNKKPLIIFNNMPLDKVKFKHKNTIDNISHFGLSSVDSNNIHISLILNNILKINGLHEIDPDDNKMGKFYSDIILKKLQNVESLSTESITENVAVKITDEQWEELVSFGNFNTSSIRFGRGTNKILDSSLLSLDEVVEKVKNLPNYYLFIKGDSLLGGDQVANNELATTRANIVRDYLITKGIPEFRLKVTSMKPTGKSEVVFEFASLPY